MSAAFFLRLWPPAPGGAAEGMWCPSRRDKPKHSRAAARLSIAAARRFQCTGNSTNSTMPTTSTKRAPYAFGERAEPRSGEHPTVTAWPRTRPGVRGASDSRLQARGFRGIHLREAEALLAEVFQRCAETGNPASRAAARRRRGPEWNGRAAEAPRPVTTWRPVDLATWTKSAGRQVVKSFCAGRARKRNPCRRREGCGRLPLRRRTRPPVFSTKGTNEDGRH